MREAARLWRRVWNGLGFGQIKATDDSGPVLRAQVKLSDLETRDRTPLVQHFGFDSNPPPDTDAVLAFLGGDRSNGVIVATNYQPARPRNIRPGETTVWNNFKMSAALTREGITINADGVTIDMVTASGLVHVTAPQQVTVDAPTAVLNASSGVTVNTPTMQVNGVLHVSGDVTGGAVSLESHVHEDDDGGTPGTTGLPVGGGAGAGGAGGSGGGGGAGGSPVATQDYVNNALLGALTPASVTVTQTGLQSAGAAASPLPSALQISRSPANSVDAPVAVLSTTISYSGLGGGGAATVLQVTSNVGNVVDATGAATDGPGNNAYNFAASLNTSALKWSGADSTPGAWSQHAAGVFSMVRTLPRLGVPAGRQMAQAWGGWFNILDQTNLPSAIGGASYGFELDMQFNNRDDGAFGRSGVGVYSNPAIALASGGYPSEVGSALDTAGHATGGQFDGFFRQILKIGGPYSVAALDTRGAQAMDTTVATGLGAPAATLHVANCWGFTSAGFPAAPVSATRQARVLVNGTVYQQTGWASDGPGTASGTLTFASAVSVADGAAGNSVSCDQSAIWLNTGQQIALSFDGTTNFHCDPQGVVRFNTYAGERLALSPARPTVTGSRGGNAAIASLLSALAGMSLITDGTTA